MSVRNNKGRFVKGENIVDLTGERFGRLTVMSLSDKRSGRKTYYDCLCDCGNKKTIRSDVLKSQTRSCGCLRNEQAKVNLVKNHKHKGSQTELHYRWLHMKGRCYNPNNEKFHRYGGRGISVCEEWKEDYEAFRDWAYGNGYKKGLSIERVDVDGNYSPENCTWIPVERQSNNRGSTIWIEYQGDRLSLMEWSKKLGINYGTLNSRYRRSGMRPPELFSPVKTTPR